MTCTCARRRTFWVAAAAGIIVFGALMGSMYIGQQFLQNVLEYSTVGAGAAILPAAVFMVLVAPRSAKLVETHGARATLLLGYVFVLLGFTTMLLLWKEGIPYWKVALGYIFVGIGVGLAGTPASHSLTGSVPVRRVGMASGTADLQRDLGGAIMQSIMGVFLTAGYAIAAGAAISASRQERQRRRRERADQVVLERGQHGRAVPAVDPGQHHRRGPELVPPGRRVGVPGRDHRRPARRGARLLHVPEAGRRAAAARRIRGRGRRWHSRPEPGRSRAPASRRAAGDRRASARRAQAVPHLSPMR